MVFLEVSSLGAACGKNPYESKDNILLAMLMIISAVILVLCLMYNKKTIKENKDKIKII